MNKKQKSSHGIDLTGQVIYIAGRPYELKKPTKKALEKSGADKIKRIGFGDSKWDM